MSEPSKTGLSSDKSTSNKSLAANRSATGKTDLGKDERGDAASEVLCQRVKQLRKKRNLTLDQLAAASGVSRSMISQIERGSVSPTLAVISRIAIAFGISIGDLVDQPWASATIERVRRDDPRHLYSSNSHCQIRTLSPLHMEKDVEFYELRLAVGASLNSAPHFEGTRELLTVTQGEALIQSGNETCRLQEGDSSHYRADLEHSIENVGNNELLCFMVVTYRTL